jgi:nucleotide-binding universal stress UspA family protein
MLKTVLVPLDGSELAARAIPYALYLALHANARIVLTRSVVTGPVRPAQESSLEARDAEIELSQAAAYLMRTHLPVEWLIMNEIPGRGIALAAQERQADLIVMSTHGRTGPGRWVYGSVAHDVLQLAPTPTLLIPAGATFNWPAESHSLRMVVPVDGSLLAADALQLGKQLAAAMGGEITLVEAVPPRDPALLVAGPVAEYDAQQELEAARDHVVGLVSNLSQQSIQSSAMVEIGDPAEVILRACRQRRAHLIVMATHSRGFAWRLLMGSVADAILRRTHLPLLLVHPRPVHAGSHETGPSTRQVAHPTPVAVQMTTEEIAVTRAALEAFVDRGRMADRLEAPAHELLYRLSRMPEPAAVDQELESNSHLHILAAHRSPGDWE